MRPGHVERPAGPDREGVMPMGELNLIAVLGMVLAPLTAATAIRLSSWQEHHE